MTHQKELVAGQEDLVRDMLSFQAGQALIGDIDPLGRVTTAIGRDIKRRRRLTAVGTIAAVVVGTVAVVGATMWHPEQSERSNNQVARGMALEEAREEGPDSGVRIGDPRQWPVRGSLASDQGVLDQGATMAQQAGLIDPHIVFAGDYGSSRSVVAVGLQSRPESPGKGVLAWAHVRMPAGAPISSNAPVTTGLWDIRSTPMLSLASTHADRSDLLVVSDPRQQRFEMSERPVYTTDGAITRTPWGTQPLDKGIWTGSTDAAGGGGVRFAMGRFSRVTIDPAPGVAAPRWVCEVDCHDATLQNAVRRDFTVLAHQTTGYAANEFTVRSMKAVPVDRHYLASVVAPQAGVADSPADGAVLYVADIVKNREGAAFRAAVVVAVDIADATAKPQPTTPPRVVQLPTPLPADDADQRPLVIPGALTDRSGLPTNDGYQAVLRGDLLRQSQKALVWLPQPVSTVALASSSDRSTVGQPHNVQGTTVAEIVKPDGVAIPEADVCVAGGSIGERRWGAVLPAFNDPGDRGAGYPDVPSWQPYRDWQPATNAPGTAPTSPGQSVVPRVPSTRPSPTPVTTTPGTLPPAEDDTPAPLPPAPMPEKPDTPPVPPAGPTGTPVPPKPPTNKPVPPVPPVVPPVNPGAPVVTRHPGVVSGGAGRSGTAEPSGVPTTTPSQPQPTSGNPTTAQ